MSTKTQAKEITLYSGPLSLFGAKVDIALREKGLPFNVVMVAFSEAEGYSPKHETVIRINPKHQVPVLIHHDVELFDSTQIFEYLEDAFPEPPLWPRERVARVKARQLELIADEFYFAQVIKLFSLQNEREVPLAQAAYKVMRQYHQTVEQKLSESPFLAGAFSYADIGFFMALLFGDRMGCALDQQTPKLTEWRTHMAARPSIQESLKPMQAYLASVSRYFPSWVYGEARDGVQTPNENRP